jgi:hypothetical protein
LLLLLLLLLNLSFVFDFDNFEPGTRNPTLNFEP